MVLTRAYRSQENLVRYWALEAVKLCKAIEGVSVVSMDEPIAQLHDALRAMARERRVMLVGAEQCGKSSLLAGLAGCPLLQQVPLDAPFVCWRYRNEDGDARNSRFVPMQDWEGLELVDSRSCGEPAVVESLRALLPGTDVLVAVVDGRNAAASPVWELLASEEAQAARTAMLAVTFASGPQTSDAMRELCQARLGRSLPVYCVNPASESAMEVFCERVQDALESQPALRADIRAAMDAADALLHKVGHTLNDMESKFRTNSGFIRQLDEDIDGVLSRQLAMLPQHMGVYADTARRALPRLLRRLRWVFGWFFSPVLILRLELLGAGVERFYYHGLREDVLQLQMDSDRSFLFSSAKHWQVVRPEMQRALSFEIGELPEAELAEELAALRERLGVELYAPFAGVQLRSHLSKIFNAHAGWMRACLTFICLFLFLAGALGVLGQDLPAIALVGVALLIWLGAGIGHMVAARRVRREVETCCAAMEPALFARIKESVELLVVARMTAYRRLYNKPRLKVAALEEELQPRRQEQRHILHQLRGVVPHL